MKCIGDLSEQELASIGRQIMHKRSKAYNKRIDQLLDVKDGPMAETMRALNATKQKFKG